VNGHVRSFLFIGSTFHEDTYEVRHLALIERRERYIHRAGSSWRERLLRPRRDTIVRADSRAYRGDPAAAPDSVGIFNPP
jgi:hypothetical protein